MPGPVLALDTDELWRALELINPVDVLVNELVGASVNQPGWGPHHVGRFVPLRRKENPELALLEDIGSGERCLLPAAGLRACRTAGLVALAARQMLVPAVVSATVLGTSPAAQLMVAVIARHVPDVGHVAVCPSPGFAAGVAPGIVEQVHRAGIGLSVTPGMADAALRANLVVVADRGPWPLHPDRLQRGTVVINATGQDVPDDLVNGVDEIYVDDAGLLESNRHRYFVQSHFMGGGRRRRSPHVQAPLARVLTGAHPGRSKLDDRLLVELLGTRTLDAPLACHLHRAALDRGLGVRRAE